MSTFCRSAYNYDADIASFDSGVEFITPSRTEQYMKDECDINFLVKQFLSGALPPPPAQWPVGPDFDEVLDFQSAMNAIVAGTEAFRALPSNVRERFRNDPHEYLAFVNDAENIHEAAALGLITRESYEAHIASLSSNDEPKAVDDSSNSD